MQHKYEDALARFEAMAARARQERPPSTNLGDAILAEINRAGWGDSRPLLYLTAGSAIAAALFAIVGISAYLQLQDPILYIHEWVRISGVY